MFEITGVIDLGVLGGASGAHKLQVPGDAIYASKSFISERPYTLVSEVLCAELASMLGLPIPARRYVTFQGNTWFGLEWRPEFRTLSDKVVSRLTNLDQVPSLIAFDIYVCNQDRHDANIVIQKVSPVLDRFAFWLIDHGHALAGPYASASQFTGDNHDASRYLRHNAILREQVRSYSDFKPFLTRLEDMSETALAEIEQAVVREWRPQPDETSLLIDFLWQMKSHVGELLTTVKDHFPNLK
jgi:hypothetical protein